MARAQGNWAQAESAYRESLTLSRQLVERLGGTPEALRDLSVSLNNVGGVAWMQGDRTQAEIVYRESLGLRRELVERLGGTPEALSDLSVSLTNLSRLPDADPAHRAEALQLHELLVKRFPDNKQYADELADLRGDNAASPDSPGASTEA